MPMGSLEWPAEELREFGYSQAEISSMRGQGIV